MTFAGRGASCRYSSFVHPPMLVPVTATYTNPEPESRL